MSFCRLILWIKIRKWNIRIWCTNIVYITCKFEPAVSSFSNVYDEPSLWILFSKSRRPFSPCLSVCKSSHTSVSDSTTPRGKELTCLLQPSGPPEPHLPLSYHTPYPALSSPQVFLCVILVYSMGHGPYVIFLFMTLCRINKLIKTWFLNSNIHISKLQKPFRGIGKMKGIFR